MKIKVLVCDDSALIRSVMSEIINSQPDMEVVGVAPDPIIARELIKQTNPDVLTLDVEMPKMDGLDFLERLMRLRPMPVVMVSSLTERGSETTLRALELGAIDFVAKPKISIQSGMRDYAELIADKIRTASRARVRARSRPADVAQGGHGADSPDASRPLPVLRTLSSPVIRRAVGVLLFVLGWLAVSQMLIGHATDPDDNFAKDFAAYHHAAQRLARPQRRRGRKPFRAPSRQTNRLCAPAPALPHGRRQRGQSGW